MRKATMIVLVRVTVQLPKGINATEEQMKGFALCCYNQDTQIETPFSNQWYPLHGVRANVWCESSEDEITDFEELE